MCWSWLLRKVHFPTSLRSQCNSPGYSKLE